MEESATFEVNRKRKKYFPSNRFCSVPKCKSRSNEEISLFLFPKNKALKNKWAKVLKIGKRVTKYMYVCSLHFLNSDLKSSDSHKRKRYLKKNAVPSQNLPENSSEDEITNDELEVIESKDEVLRQKKENIHLDPEVPLEVLIEEGEDGEEWEPPIEQNLTCNSELKDTEMWYFLQNDVIYNFLKINTSVCRNVLFDIR